MARQAPELVYVIYSDAHISNISLSYGGFTNSEVEGVQPSQDLIIPLSCDNPLQCGIPTQQNMLSEIYIPNKENTSLILLKIEDENLYSYNITTPCVFNDFALQPYVDDYPLLIACVLTENDAIRYILSNQYGNVSIDREWIQAVVNPIIVAPLLSSFMYIISINNQNEVVVVELGPGDSESRHKFPLPTLAPPCVPAEIKNVATRLDMIFLLTCEDGRSYLVNIFIEPIRLIRLSYLPNSMVLALANYEWYSLIFTMINSTAILTIQELLSQSNTTRIIQLDTVVIYGADFGPDDKFAYVTTNRGIVFINVLMALKGAEAENFTHTVTIPLCFQCPSVVFLSNTIALVSSTEVESYQLLIFNFSSWPPVNSLNKTLIKQPKCYWYEHWYRDVAYCCPPTLPSVSPTDSEDTKDHLSGRTIGGIVGGISATVVVIIVTVTIITYITKAVHCLHWRNEQLVSR